MKKYKIQLTALSEKDLGLAYLSFKDALYDVSVAAFGWDETFQHGRFMKAYEPEWFYWIEHDSQKVGYTCFVSRQNDIHVHLLIVDKKFQGKGYGKETMELIAEIAKAGNLDVTLSTLKNNTGAVKLYENLGYKITDQDEYFYDMALKG
ncbi:MAG: GNAT family N-acetyltransferase [Rhizobacter sp.]|nr:GNAT family N-acetyltransferase [Bacteriovorax sp.]